MNINYSTINGCFYLLDQRTNEYSEYLCTEVNVESVLVDVVSQKQTVCVSFEIGDNKVEERIAREDFLGRQWVKSLIACGLDILEKDISTLCAILRDKESEAEKIMTHSKIGYLNTQQFGTYYLDSAIGSERESLFSGEKDIEANGCENDWLEMVQDVCKDNMPLQMAMAVGFSAPIAARLNTHSNTDNLIVSFTGATSTGKTTALMLLASIWGRPDLSRHGILSSFNATANAQMRLLVNKIGFPVFIDESASAGNKVNWSSFIYDLSNGVEKERCDSSLELKERVNWLTTIIITSERSMFENVSNDGVKLRLVEMPFKFFDSAADADRVKSTVKEIYGHAGRKFAEFLSTCSDNRLMRTYNKIVARFEKELNNDKCKEKNNERIRMMRKLSVFVLTAVLVNKADIGIKFEIKKMISEVIELERLLYKKRGDIAEEAFECVKSKIVENYSKLYVYKKHNRKNNVPWSKSYIGSARYDDDDNLKCIWVLSEVMETFLNDAKYKNNLKSIFESWIRSGKLKRPDKGRLNSSRKISNVNVRVNILNMEDDSFSTKIEEIAK